MVGLQKVDTITNLDYYFKVTAQQGFTDSLDSDIKVVLLYFDWSLTTIRLCKGSKDKKYNISIHLTWCNENNVNNIQWWSTSTLMKMLLPFNLSTNSCPRTHLPSCWIKYKPKSLIITHHINEDILPTVYVTLNDTFIHWQNKKGSLKDSNSSKWILRVKGEGWEILDGFGGAVVHQTLSVL